MTSTSCTVLTSATLFSLIVSFQCGLPRDIVELARECQRLARDRASVRVYRETSAQRRRRVATNPRPRTVPQLAVQRRHLRVLQRLERYKQEQLAYAALPLLQLTGVWMASVSSGDVEIAAGADAYGPSTGFRRAMDASELWCRAIASREPAMMDYLATHHPYLVSKIDEDHIEWAVECRALAVLEWLEVHVLPTLPFAPTPIVLAAKHGALDVLQHYHKKSTEHGWSPAVMDTAAAFGHLDVVVFLHTHRNEGCTTSAMDYAAAHDHLPVVQYLHEHRTEGCTTKAMDMAAADGYLDVVQFLHAYRAEGGTTRALDRAAFENRVGVVRFLLDHRTEGGTADAIRGALRHRDLVVATMLHEHRLRTVHDAALISHIDFASWQRTATLLKNKTTTLRRAMERAACTGDRGVTQILHLHGHDQCTADVAVEAADHAQAQIVSFLIAHCDAAAAGVGRVVVGAVRSGDLETTTRAAAYCSRDELVSAHALATRRGLDDIAGYLATMIATKKACVVE